MEKEIFICFKDDNLKNKQTRICAEYGSVMFNRDNVSVTRASYDKDFLDFVLYCDGITGGFFNDFEDPTTRKPSTPAPIRI